MSSRVDRWRQSHVLITESLAAAKDLEGSGYAYAGTKLKELCAALVGMPMSMDDLYRLQQESYRNGIVEGETRKAREIREALDF